MHDTACLHSSCSIQDQDYNSEQQHTHKNVSDCIQVDFPPLLEAAQQGFLDHSPVTAPFYLARAKEEKIPIFKEEAKNI